MIANEKIFYLVLFFSFDIVHAFGPGRSSSSCIGGYFVVEGYHGKSQDEAADKWADAKKYSENKETAEQLSICHDNNDLILQIGLVSKEEETVVSFTIHSCERSKEDERNNGDYDCHTDTTPFVDCDGYFVIETVDWQWSNQNDGKRDDNVSILKKNYEYTHSEEGRPVLFCYLEEHQKEIDRYYFRYNRINDEPDSSSFLYPCLEESSTNENEIVISNEIDLLQQKKSKTYNCNIDGADSGGSAEIISSCVSYYMLETYYYSENEDASINNITLKDNFNNTNNSTKSRDDDLNSRHQQKRSIIIGDDCQYKRPVNYGYYIMIVILCSLAGTSLFFVHRNLHCAVPSSDYETQNITVDDNDSFKSIPEEKEQGSVKIQSLFFRQEEIERVDKQTTRTISTYNSSRSDCSVLSFEDSEIEEEC